MEVINTLEKIGKLSDMTGISLGSFDGLHKGHLTLINVLMKKCREKNLRSVIYTFSNHPRAIVNSKISPRLIINNKQKINLLNKIGIDTLIMVDFDDFQKNIRAGEFIEKILIDKFNMGSMIVGKDCRFGKDAEGNVSLLRQFSREYGYDLTVVPPAKIENKIISSTVIRKLLSEGMMKRANLFIGRNYSITGKVIKGKQFGSKCGFPTANISLDFSMCLPKPGVYVTKTIIDKNIYNSMTNVGFNPTFNQNSYNIETHILEFNKDIYNKEVEIEFIDRIRDEIKFNSIEALYRQINKDLAYTKEFYK